jgi:hypothetical protein
VPQSSRSQWHGSIDSLTNVLGIILDRESPRGINAAFDAWSDDELAQFDGQLFGLCDLGSGTGNVVFIDTKRQAKRECIRAQQFTETEGLPVKVVRVVRSRFPLGDWSFHFPSSEVSRDYAAAFASTRPLAAGAIQRFRPAATLTADGIGNDADRAGDRRL